VPAGRLISMSLVAVAVALLVLVLVLLALALGAVELVGLGDVVVLVLGAATLVTGALVPLAAVPDPLTVAAFTTVEPEAFTLPEPVFVAPTAVVPVALVVACKALSTPPVPVFSTGAELPLAAVPEPLTVAAFRVVEPVALTAPEPLLVALTVVEPVALVIAVCAIAELPNVRPSRAVLTAAATVLL